MKELDKVDPALATLDRFYKEEAAYLAAGGGDFSAIAATLDPECVIFQPASLPYGGKWRGHAGFEAWRKRSYSSGPLWRCKTQNFSLMETS